MLLMDADYWRVRDNVVADFIGRYPYHGDGAYYLNLVFVDGHAEMNVTKGVPFF
jgi:prepilin-type processing-associated H-X9-DG protein